MGERSGQADGAPLHANGLGPIATSYDQLQGLPDLFAVTRKPGTAPAGSADQALRALVQASEVALVTLTCSAEQARSAIAKDDEDDVRKSLGWMVAYARGWADIAWRIGDLEPTTGSDAPVSCSILESPNWQRHDASARRLAGSYLSFRAHSTTAQATDRLILQYTLLERTALERTVLCRTGDSYADFVDPDGLDDVVRRTVLPGNTVFIPFRSAHQISEILVDAANDHLDSAICSLDGGEEPLEIVEILRRVDRLLDAVVTVADVLAENLHLDDYHEIRENLGLTSGSHSVGLHYHLMRDLYPALAARVQDGVPPLVRAYVRSVGRHIDRWRTAHLALPRQNLGGARGGTRSLTGAPDALHTVQRMRERGWAADPLATRLAPLSTDVAPPGSLPMEDVEAAVLEDIAHRTQERFPDVQARRGIFAQPSAFETPPIRRPQSDRAPEDR